MSANAAIYLVRHAPTASNRNNMFMGQADVPALAVDETRDWHVPASGPRSVYCSPLSRARTSAEILFPAERIIMDERLVERHAGEWEGLGHHEVGRRWPEAFVDGQLNPQIDPPGGETIERFRKRVASFLEEIADRHVDGDLFVVTHNGWIRMARHLNGEIPFDRLFAETVPFLCPMPFEPRAERQQSGLSG